MTPGCVFVSLFTLTPGRALSFGAVYDLVSRLRRRTGIAFTPHMFRHTYATRLLRRGVGLEVVQRLLGHASLATTLDTYGHLRAEDLRIAMRRAGALDAQAETATADHAGGDAADHASAVRLW